ncbi:sigma-70 family RNA polymerase sigma factor [Indioceanicola profundi]|uniref:sigma-70 family RNA polymerase sigma factor n=1 Tax=Indioceanicola profundi TaxID=2220096 RepID=UPI0013C49B83|nr:sigma-70 family RNA polymerase sigma factor [Indioceanicola profundi]
MRPASGPDDNIRPTGRTGLRLTVSAEVAPLLTQAEEEALIARWQKGRDKRALDALLVSHLRLVIAIAARYRRQRHGYEDLVQEGVLGLSRAIERYRPDAGARFATYAAWWVKSAVRDAVYRNSSIVRPSMSARHLRAFFQAGSAVEAQILLPRDMSIHAPLSEEGSGTMADLLADEGESPEEMLVRRRQERREETGLWAALAALNPREHRIIAARHLTEQPKRLAEIGRELGISGERVRQIETAALAKLRKMMQPEHVEA